MSNTRRATCVIFTFGLCWLVQPAAGQVENPVYVDDSPQAWELFRQAQDQTAQNAGEAVRLYQELLDDFGMKLIPASEAAADHFKAVRQRVLDALINDPQLLERYRTIQQPLAEQLLAAGELEQLARSRPLTEAGLDALLQLAQRDLEQGRFNAAMAYLRQAASHPDCYGRRAMHTHFMTGVAAHYLGKTQIALDALQQLKQIENGVGASELEACRSQLAALVQGSQPSDETDQTSDGRPLLPQRTAVSTFGSMTSLNTEVDSAHPEDLADVVAQTIWSVPLDTSLASRRAMITEGDEPFNAPSGIIRRIDRTADLTTAVPTVSGETVYVNEGHTVRAINRLTGREVWTYTNLNAGSLSERDIMTSLDVNVVAVSPAVRAQKSEGRGQKSEVGGQMEDADQSSSTGLRLPSGGSGQWVVTLTGYAQPGGRSEAGRVICLDAQTGSLEWSANLMGLVDGASSEQLFPHGVPLIADGLVFVAARRISMQAMTNAYVVAIDLETGQVRWVRYITSSGGLQARIRPFCTLVHHDGHLYVASAVGATAKLDPGTGEILWLHRFSTPISITLADQVRRPWELGGPVVTPLGVLAIEPDQRHVILLDTETGSPLMSMEAGTSGGWNQPRYLLANDEMVFAIGNEIRAFRLDDLQNVAWRLPDDVRSDASAPRVPGSPVRGPASVEIRGRVQLIAGALVVPTAEGMLIVDSETGEITNSIPIQPAGNPLAVESQLIVAASDRLDAYMSFAKAERMLRDRIAQTPDDPEPALSLVRLAMRVQKLPLALEASDLAMRAIDRASIRPSDPGDRTPSDARAELLSLLLEIAESRLAATPDEGELLFAAIDAAAQDPVQRVEYLLAYGQWLSGHALNRAVEAYQTILSNRTLAESWLVRDGVMRSSASWAQERLGQLIASAAAEGRTAYAPQADFAALRLKQITGTNPAAADPAQLLALAQEFPFSDAAVEAALQAATTFVQRGDHRAAAAGLVNLYRANPQPEAARRLLGKLVSVCTAAGWHTQVNSIIRHTARAHGELTLVSDSGPISPTTWLASRSGTIQRLPVIGNIAHQQGQPSTQVMPGALVEPHPLSAGGAPSSTTTWPDRVLLRIGNSVRLLGSDLDPSGSGKWTTTLTGRGAENPQLLRMTEHDVLLWLESEGHEAHAVMLNGSDGRVRWTTEPLTQALGEVIRDVDRGQRRFGEVGWRGPDGETHDSAELLPLVTDQWMVVVRRGGGLVCFDLRQAAASAPRVAWLKRAGETGLEQVHFAAMHESALVLAGVAREIGEGRSGAADAPLVPRIAVFDPATGERIHEQSSALRDFGRSPASGVKWMRVSAMGELIFGTTGGLHVVDLYSGRRLWSSSSYEVIDSQRAWQFESGPGALIIEDQRSRLRSVNMRDGTVSDAFEMPMRGEWDPLELRSLQLIGGRVVALYPQRVVVYDPVTGAAVGWDVISDDRDYRFLLPAEGKLVLVNSHAMQVPIPDQPGRRSQRWEYLLYVLSDNGKVLSEPLTLDKPLTERVQNAALIDGWLLLSTSSDTVPVPLK